MREGKPLPYEMRCILFVGEDIILPLKLVGGNMRTVEDACPYGVVYCGLLGWFMCDGYYD